MTLGQDYLPSRIGTSSGVTLGLGITVGGVVAPGLGALADVTSPRTSILVLLAFLPVGLVVALRLHDPRGTGPGAGAPQGPAPHVSAPAPWPPGARLHPPHVRASAPQPCRERSAAAGRRPAVVALVAGP